MKHARKDTVKTEIVALHGFLNKYHTKVVATIKYNDRQASVNIRKCWRDLPTGELLVGTGITLTPDELDALREILNAHSNGKLDEIDVDGRKAVVFDDIFSSAANIVEKRDAGHVTEDGYACLSWKPGKKRRGEA